MPPNFYYNMQDYCEERRAQGAKWTWYALTFKIQLGDLFLPVGYICSCNFIPICSELLRSTASHAELRPWFCPIVSSHSELASATLLCPAGFATVSEKARHIFVHLCNAVHHPSWIAADQCVKL